MASPAEMTQNFPVFSSRPYWGPIYQLARELHVL